MQVSLLTTQLLLALQAQAAVKDPELPEWLEGLWERDDVYVMDPTQPGAANDGLTEETSWPTIVRYPCVARASATYPSPNGTKAYPNGVKVIVFLPGDYSMRKMHPVRVTEYWPHWDSAPDVGLEPSSVDPLILVYANENGSYSGMTTHPKMRDENHQADFGVLAFSTNTHGVYVHGLRSIAEYSGVDYNGSTDGKTFNCWIETQLANGITRRNGAHRHHADGNFLERVYPWSALNDYVGLVLKDGPNEDVLDTNNVVINYADSLQMAMRGALYRQDPITINITAPGTGYTVGDALVFGDGTAVTYRHAVGTVATVDGGGGITSVTTTDQGAYTGGFPSVTIVGTGSGATFTCTALAGPTIAFGQNLVAPDIWEQGWVENDGYGGAAGYEAYGNYFGCTDEVKNSTVYDTLGGIENCIDIKCGGTVGNPVLIHDNYLFGLRANLSSPTAAITMHDVTTYVQIYDNYVLDCSSVFNLNAGYVNDRLPNDGGSTGGVDYPAWQAWTTVLVTGNKISDIENFATHASWSGQQGRVFYGNNNLTFQNNELNRVEYLADEAVSALAPDLVLGGNLLHEPVDLDGYATDWTDGTISSGYTEEVTEVTVPYTSQVLTIRRMVPN